ncbi:sialate O-acetylesterase [Aestuariicella sp. G3-2]|uniref:sialate O-acetylesterase n=1 Tax=Pseudomaricurvus albidus TaxID=2842452 RepID=UPI001C0E416A|nr:sialate O-acetylesterase [Aestuariicella albida]MBU3071329.1 sialate O-acetylesterase [Aestuariicella albida]
MKKIPIQKLSIKIAILILSMSLGLQAEGSGMHLFILSGQSNMSKLDAKASFLPIVESEFGADKVIIVKSARVGQPIRRWYKAWTLERGVSPEDTGDLYDRLMEKVYKSIKGKKIKTVSFIWMQGERDARKRHGAVYAESLKGLIEQLAHDLNRNDITFVIGRLSDFDMENKIYPDWTTVRRAQEEVAESSPLGTWIDTDSYNDMISSDGKKTKNGLHYSPEGYIKLGEAFARAAIELIHENKSETN